MTEQLFAKKQEVTAGVDISRASDQDLDAVWAIIDACAQWLADQDLKHWADHYTREMMAKIIRKLEVYVASQEGKAVSTITVGLQPPKYYVTEGYVQRFADPEAAAAYIMALGVLPTYQGRGVAGKLLTFAEGLAKQRGVEWLRLDCRAEVPGLVQFYEKRGFHTVGESLPEGVNETYWLMEKRISE